MRFDRRLTGIGLFLIFCGAVLLAVRQGLISATTAERAWTLWPLLLIGTGLSLVLAGRPASATGGLIVAVTLGTMAGALVGTGGGFPLIGCSGAHTGSAFPAQTGQLGPVASARVEFRCGELSLGVVAGSAWRVEGSSADGQPPKITATADQIVVEPGDNGGPVFLGGASETWRISVPAASTLAVEVTVNAGDGRVDLGGGELSNTTFVVNAGSSRIDLRNALAAGSLVGSVNAGSATVWLPALALTGDLSVNAGSLNLCAPPNIGLRLVTSESVAASNDFADRGLIHTGDAWETAGYATAAVKIVLNVSANAGSVSLNGPRACAA